ncbi:MAG: Unknown protein [uncultured Sulfurovum sp.]|uniref:DUF898 domain-containing protein n=1 Tax=uncultured Sulfurovum sp. TaxID=269237 RepID=A0A6S6S0T1_9BACT|nr:MAG: Unknown protein [uncultured Sulfurovum sp.]
MVLENIYVKEKQKDEQHQVDKVITEAKYFEFKGSGSEYFRIWIVNIALTILTLGIYSAWAKVRANRYLYANTYLNGSNFEYNADPVRILIGRVIVVALYGFFVIFSQYLFMFEVAGAIALLAFIAMPWLVRQAVCFKLRNTSYRHVPFRYEGSVGSFYLFFIWHIILNIFTLMLIFPYSYVKFKELIINNAHYGDGNFKFVGKSGSVYGIYIKMFLWSTMVLLSVTMVLTTLGVGVVSTFQELSTSDVKVNSDIVAILGSLTIFLLYLPFIFWNKGLSDGYFSNYVRNHTTLNGSELKGEMQPFKLGVISAGNALAILFSLGLLYPWAKIRYLKYKLEHSSFTCKDYEQFQSHGYVTGSSVGEEMVDFFDIDIGL